MIFSELRIIVGLLGGVASVISLPYYAEAQTIPIPEFEPEPPRPTDFAMKVQLEPHENKSARADGKYQVSNFAIAISNSSKLCPTGNCEFDLDGEMFGDLDLVYLDGKLRVNTGDSTKIRDLNADWQTVEEREQDGETVQIIEGELRLGDITMPEYNSQINGTLVPDSNGFILELTGTAGSPYT